MPPNIPQDLFNQFSAVDSYINSSLLPHDAGLESALNNNHAKNLDEIDVAPNQGKLLYLLAKINHASRILEVGTLGGYSAIWFATAVAGKENAKVITCEIDPDSAKIAESNIANAGFSSTVEVRVGPALETLSAMEKDENTGTFDMVFIDADKENNVNYIKYALKFAKVGTLIVVDNVVRRGRIMDSENKEPSIEGTRKTYEFLGQEKRVESTAVQTVGLKGWDGFALAYVVE
jgi:predicted O-methyltransferase YrrM